MSEVTLEAMRDKYPKIFSQPASVGCGAGWYDIIDTLCGMIQSYIDGVEDQRIYAMNKNLMLERARAGDWAMFNESMHLIKNREWVEKERELFLNSHGLPVPELVPQVVVRQVKEKFGELRFYVEGGDRYTQGMIDMAEGLSCVTCDECGATGERGGTNWIRTRCELHKEPARF